MGEWVKFERDLYGKSRYILHLWRTDYIFTEEQIKSIQKDIEDALSIGDKLKEENK